MSNLKSKTYQSLSKPPSVSTPVKSQVKRKNTSSIPVPRTPVPTSFPISNLQFWSGRPGTRKCFSQAKIIDFVNHWLKIDSKDSDINFKAMISEITHLKFAQEDKGSALVIVLQMSRPIPFHSKGKSTAASYIGFYLHTFDNFTVKQISKDLKAIIGNTCKYSPLAESEKIKTFATAMFKEKDEFIPDQATVTNLSKRLTGKESTTKRTTRSIKSGVTMIYDNEDLVDEKLDNLMIADPGDTQYEDISPDDQIYFHPKLEISLNDKSHFTISNKDFKCLYNGNWINDSIVDFFINLNFQQTNNNINTQRNYKIEILNSFFYTSLSRPVKDGDYYKNVKSWFKNKNDLFQNDYVIIPIMQDMHWYVVILKNLENLINVSKDSVTYIYFLDSLNKRHTICGKVLKSFITGYAEEKHPQININVSNILEKDSSVPKQDNFNDCGIHVICNIKLFLQDPEVFNKLILKLNSSEEERDQFFALDDRYQMRKSLRDQLLNLLKPQVLKSGNQVDLLNFGLTYSQLENIGYKTGSVENNEHLQDDDGDDDDLVIINVVKKDLDIDPNNIINLKSPKKGGRRRRLKAAKSAANKSSSSDSYLVTLKTKSNASAANPLENYERKNFTSKELKFRKQLEELRGVENDSSKNMTASTELEADEDEVAEIKNDFDLLSNTQSKHHHHYQGEEPVLSQDSFNSSPVKLTDHTLTHITTESIPELPENISKVDPEYKPQFMIDVKDGGEAKKEILRKSRSSDVIEIPSADINEVNMSRRRFNPPFDSRVEMAKRAAQLTHNSHFDPSVISGAVPKQKRTVVVKKNKLPSKTENSELNTETTIFGASPSNGEKQSRKLDLLNSNTSLRSKGDVSPDSSQDRIKLRAKNQVPINSAIIRPGSLKQSITGPPSVTQNKKSSENSHSPLTIAKLQRLRKTLFDTTIEQPIILPGDKRTKRSSSIENPVSIDFERSNGGDNKKRVVIDIDEMEHEKTLLPSKAVFDKPKHIKNTIIEDTPSVAPHIISDNSKKFPTVVHRRSKRASHDIKESKDEINDDPIILVSPVKGKRQLSLSEPIVLVSPMKTKREPSIVEVTHVDDPIVLVSPVKTKREISIVENKHVEEPKKHSLTKLAKSPAASDSNSKSSDDPKKPPQTVSSRVRRDNFTVSKQQQPSPVIANYETPEVHKAPRKMLSPKRVSNIMTDSSPIKLTDGGVVRGSNKDNAIVINEKPASFNVKKEVVPKRRLRSSPPNEDLDNISIGKAIKKKPNKRPFIDIESDSETSNSDIKRQSLSPASTKDFFKMREVRHQPPLTNNSSRYRIRNIFEDDEEPSPEFEIFSIRN